MYVLKAMLRIVFNVISSNCLPQILIVNCPSITQLHYIRSLAKLESGLKMLHAGGRQSLPTPTSMCGDATNSKTMTNISIAQRKTQRHVQEATN